jgi:hypothetical protein
MSLDTEFQFGELLLIAVGIGIAVYYIKKIPNALGLPGGVTDAASNAATGTLTDSQIKEIAAQTAVQVAKAGGSKATQQSSAQEVTNFANWSKPLGGFLGFGGVSSDTEVPGTGNTIYQLRAIGYSDADITSMFDNPVQAILDPNQY